MAGAVNTSYTFTATDVITSTKMNNIIDETVMTSDAIIGSTLAVSTGKLRVNTSGITANELATGSVTTTAILDANVTTAKIANSNVTTAKIADLNVTTAKIADSNVTTAKIADASVTAAKLNGLQTGTAPIYGTRAYGAFDGTATSPITPINAGNITSITRNSTGNYTVVMTTAMPDANYCVVANEFHHASFFGGTSCSITIINSSSFSIDTLNQQGSAYNPLRIDFVVFR
jgi:hypothetical protein